MAVNRRVLSGGLLLFALACRSHEGPPPAAINLAGLYVPPPAAPSPLPPGSEPGRLLPLKDFKAGPGVADLRVVDGKLAGKATSASPVLHLDWTGAPTDADTLHSIEIKMRVSAGSAVAFGFSGQEKGFDLKKQLDSDPIRLWRTTAPIHAGDEIRTVQVLPPMTRPARSLRHILIRPTDTPGATFSIESVRVILREDYVESVPSGVSWQGLSEIYHETLVSRAPEELTFNVKLPSDPWLDLHIGTFEDGPITFRVRALIKDGGPNGGSTAVTLLERTITRPHRWEPAPVDLSAFAGKKIVLGLGLESGSHASSSHDAVSAGAVGFWGSPVVRERSPRLHDGAPRGVIVVWADTLRRDHLQPYGCTRPTSPNIAKLAAEGTLFEDCIGQATWTKVATPAMMTSLYPATNGVREFFDRLPASATTMAEVFRDAGYATVSYSSILFTGQMTNLHKGFEEVNESGSLPDEESSKTAREYIDRLLPWIESHKAGPFFVFLHVSDPHDPFKPYPPYDTLFNDGAKAEEHERQAEAAKKFIADPLLKDFGMPSRAELVKAGIDPDAYTAFNEGWYDGSIRGMDAEIGRLMERLRTLRLLDTTLLVFTGDHGEEFLEHGRSFHGQSVYGELNNVPLIFHRPGAIPAGARVSETVESIDIMPTVLAMSGLPIPGEAQGRSLIPLLAGVHSGDGGGAAAAAEPAWEPRPAISEKAATKSGDGSPPPHDTESFTIVEGGWKLIRNSKRSPDGPEFELFDERRDPLNAHDVAADHPEIVGRMAKELAAWRSKAESARLAPDSETNKTLKPEDLERLRSLGYVR
jgi:arylsulfatase A-like enzyme